MKTNIKINHKVVVMKIFEFCSFFQDESLAAVCAEGFTIQDDGSCEPSSTHFQIKTILFHINFKLIMKTSSLYPVSVSDMLVFFIAQAGTNLNRLPLNDPMLCHYSIDMVLNDTVEATVQRMSNKGHINIWDYHKHLDVRVEILTLVLGNISKAIEEIEKAFLPDDSLRIGEDLFEAYFQAVKAEDKYQKHFNLPRNLSYEISSLNISEVEKNALNLNSYNNDNDKGVVPYWDRSWFSTSGCPVADKDIEIWPRPFESRFKILYDSKEFQQYMSYRHSGKQKRNICPSVETYESDGIFVCVKDFTQLFSSSVTVLTTANAYKITYLSIVFISLSLVLELGH